VLLGCYQRADCTCFAQAACLGNTPSPGLIDAQQIGLEFKGQVDGCK
jgi:hypothetical protein